MFDQYDNTEKTYEVVYSDKTVEKMTAQELYEFFIFTETNISGDFYDLKKRLDSGNTVTARHLEWDWSAGVNVYKGGIVITRCTPPEIPNKSNKKNYNVGCNHEGMYINEAGGVRFWVCPKCKKDLGDA